MNRIRQNVLVVIVFFIANVAALALSVWVGTKSNSTLAAGIVYVIVLAVGLLVIWVLRYRPTGFGWWTGIPFAIVAAVVTVSSVSLGIWKAIGLFGVVVLDLVLLTLVIVATWSRMK